MATPQLLELSGIGNPEILKKHGIEVRHASAAVGENFRDHINARIAWRVKEKHLSDNHMARGLGSLGQALKYITTGGGFFSLPSAPMLAFLRTRPELATPDVQMHIVPYAIKDPKTRKLQEFPSMAMACYQLRPESLGSIHIRSPDPDTQPAIRFNFLTDPIDQRAIVDGFRMTRRIVEAKPMDAYRGEEYSPGIGVASDAEILTFIRSHAHTAYHPIGTCRMGPAGPKTVVDEKLRLHGIEGLADRGWLDLPDDAVRQHQCAVYHGGREGSRPDPQCGVSYGVTDHVASGFSRLATGNERRSLLMG